MEKLNLIASATFGLEATVKREITRLGYKITGTQDGQIAFSADISAICEANIWLRSTSRILIKIGEFSAITFDELFEQTKALPWGDWIPEDGRFIVIGKSVKSKLFSVSDCQSIVEKAVVEKLKQKYKVSWFEKTGAEYRIQVALMKDTATLTIDTTGPGLHKRGYREISVAAPIKETLASALVELSYYKPDRILLDPLCGSGTIPIEAALIAKNIAPGLTRKFVSEEWPQIDAALWKEARKKAYAAMNTNFTPEIYGSDMDAKAIETAKENAEIAGVGDCIHFTVKKFSELTLPGEYGIVICNPPYGERIGQLNEVEELYQDMGRVFKKNPSWSVYVITSHEDFEKLYGRKADAKRKLFNGNVKTDYYQFYGPKPKY